VFLYEGKSIFFGTYAELEKSTEPIVQEFLELDELKLGFEDHGGLAEPECLT